MRGRGIERIYWISTVLLASLMLAAGIQDVRHAPDLLAAIHRLGYPEYFLGIIGTSKLVGAPVLVIPRWPRLKEWAYAGFCFDFGGAILSHSISGDSLAQTFPALACASLLAISYVSYRMRDARHAVAAAQAKVAA